MTRWLDDLEQRLGDISVSGAVNFACADTHRLYITTDTAVWIAELEPEHAPVRTRRIIDDAGA